MGAGGKKGGSDTDPADGRAGGRSRFGDFREPIWSVFNVCVIKTGLARSTHLLWEIPGDSFKKQNLHKNN